jgi:hypothetical protein
MHVFWLGEVKVVHGVVTATLRQTLIMGNQLPKAVGRILNPKRVASSIRNALNCVLVLSAGPDRIKIIARLCSGCLCPGTQVILIVEFIHG